MFVLALDFTNNVQLSTLNEGVGRGGSDVKIGGDIEIGYYCLIGQGRSGVFTCALATIYNLFRIEVWVPSVGSDHKIISLSN